MYYEDDSDTVEDNELWVNWFCRTRPNFVPIDSKYLTDDFSLAGLHQLFSDIELMKSYVTGPKLQFAHDRKSCELEAEVELFYGMVHARYILTPGGMLEMETLFKNRIFGICPRCISIGLLPIGRDPIPGQGGTYGYCVRCREVYTLVDSDYACTDGSYYGNTFCHMFELQARQKQRRPRRS